MTIFFIVVNRNSCKPEYLNNEVGYYFIHFITAGDSIGDVTNIYLHFTPQTYMDVVGSLFLIC